MSSTSLGYLFDDLVFFGNGASSKETFLVVKDYGGGGKSCSFNIREKSVYPFMLMETQGHGNIDIDLVNDIKRLGSIILSLDQGL